MTDRPTLKDTDFCADPLARVGSANELPGNPRTGVLRVHKFGGTSVDGSRAAQGARQDHQEADRSRCGGRFRYGRRQQRAEWAGGSAV